MEIWKDIEGYEELFQVSNEGRIRRKRDCKIKKISLNGNNYPFARLTKGRKGKSILISHLVANTFMERDKSSRFVIHKDGDVRNNMVSNLYWSKTNDNLSKRISKSVVAYKLNGILVGEYKSMSLAAKELGVSVSEISRCCINEGRKGTRGYLFKLVKDEKGRC